MFRTPVGRQGLEPSPLLLALHGQRVRLRGYRVVQEEAGPGQFWLSPRPLRMSEHADGEANDLPLNGVLVFWPSADPDQDLPPPDTLLELEGTLHWGRQEMPDGRVNWLRLQLSPATGGRDCSPLHPPLWSRP